jgi:hypothetical protein
LIRPGRRIFIPVIILLAALILLGLGYFPVPHQTVIVEAKPIYSDPFLDESPQPNIKQIEVVFPSFIRDGDTGTITLKVVLALDDGDFILNSPALVEVRLELPGYAVQPQGILAQPLLEKEISFQWDVRPYFPRNQGGNIWVYFVQTGGEETMDRELLFAPVIDMRVISVPVLSWGWARGMGWGLLGLAILTLLWVALYNKGGY